MIKPPGNWRSWSAWFSLRPWQRHSLVLMVGGLVYIGIGISFMTVTELSPQRQMSVEIALRMFSLDIWGLQFIGAGSLAVLSSRWPQFSDSWGYAVLTSLASAWSAIYLFGYILGDAPSTNLIQALDWALIAFIWWAISGLNNPDRRRVPRHERN